MQEYSKRMENFYREIRIFRHDFFNIICTMGSYIDEGNINDLKKYYTTKILKSGEILFNDNDFQLNKLQLIYDPAIKSLLYTKIITIINQQLHFNLELSKPLEKISSEIIDNLNLCRVLGILIDNAIEAATISDEKDFNLAIFSKNNSTIFILANSTTINPFTFTDFAKEGFTTKHNHDGLGLISVQKILQHFPSVFLSTECENNIFRQTLTIFNKISDEEIKEK